MQLFCTFPWWGASGQGTSREKTQAGCTIPLQNLVHSKDFQVEWEKKTFRKKLYEINRNGCILFNYTHVSCREKHTNTRTHTHIYI